MLTMKKNDFKKIMTKLESATRFETLTIEKFYSVIAIKLDGEMSKSSHYNADIFDYRIKIGKNVKTINLSILSDSFKKIILLNEFYKKLDLTDFEVTLSAEDIRVIDLVLENQEDFIFFFEQNCSKYIEEDL